MFGLIIYFVLVSMPTLQYYSQNSEMLLRMYEQGGRFPSERDDFSGFVIWMFYFLNVRTENVITVQELVLRRLFHISCTQEVWRGFGLKTSGVILVFPNSEV